MTLQCVCVCERERCCSIIIQNSSCFSTCSVSSDIIGLLKSVVLEPEQGSARVRLISSAILRELTPSKYIELNDFGPPVELLNVPYFLPVLLAQTNTRDRLSKLSPIIIRWVLEIRP